MKLHEFDNEIGSTGNESAFCLYQARKIINFKTILIEKL